MLLYVMYFMKSNFILYNNSNVLKNDFHKGTGCIHRIYLSIYVCMYLFLFLYDLMKCIVQFI